MGSAYFFSYIVELHSLSGKPWKNVSSTSVMSFLINVLKHFLLSRTLSASISLRSTYLPKPSWANLISSSALQTTCFKSYLETFHAIKLKVTLFCTFRSLCSDITNILTILWTFITTPLDLTMALKTFCLLVIIGLFILTFLLTPLISNACNEK